jgi:hypothetical protein
MVSTTEAFLGKVCYVLLSRGAAPRPFEDPVSDLRMPWCCIRAVLEDRVPDFLCRDIKEWEVVFRSC